jgi:hypothetical protein
VHECARDRLEQLVRYVCRPAISAKRLEAVGPHHVRIWLKNEWKGAKNAVLLTRRELAIRVLAQIPLPKRPSSHYHGIWAPGAKDRDLVVPALGDRVAHNKRKHGAKCAGGDGKDVGDDREGGAGASAGGESGTGKPDSDSGAGTAAPPPLDKPAANDGAAVAPTALIRGGALPTGSAGPTQFGDATAKAISTKLLWAEALKRAWGFDILQCPCGGRRRLLAAIRNPTQIEKILRHIGQWREGSAQGDDDVVAIRGPPGSFDEVDETPGDEFDGVDAPVDQDWAA